MERGTKTLTPGVAEGQHPAGDHPDEASHRLLLFLGDGVLVLILEAPQR